MMRGELLCWDGRRIRLPDAVEWRFQYGCGTPCDSFQITCLWEPDSGNDLAEAVSFTAEENGERLFTGVVDECERGWDTAGGTLTVAGRGMAARLLDNEALGADYQVATVEDILRDHVAPYGIEIVRGAELPPVPGFSVDAGSSEWQVVYEFCRYYGGIAPRFDRLGRLVLAPWEEGRRLVLGADAAVTSFRLREQRYGVLSEVLVRDRTTEEVQRVADEDFLRRGVDGCYSACSLLFPCGWISSFDGDVTFFWRRVCSAYHHLLAAKWRCCRPDECFYARNRFLYKLRAFAVFVWISFKKSNFEK